MLPFESIIYEPLDKANTQDCRKLYGVEFVPPSKQEIGRFTTTCDILISEQQRLLDETKHAFTINKPAIVYMPTAFLAKKLHPKQVEAINERETPQVAAYCVGVQEQLIRVPINESHERLSHIPSIFRESRVSATFSEIPFPDVSGEWAHKPQEFWVRESFAERLVFMGSILNKIGVQIHFIEAFRPVGVQEGMFRRRIIRTRNEHPKWSEQEVTCEARSKTASTPRLASHKGGAAVDILLQRVDDDSFLDFGHDYPDGGVLVFPRTPYVTAEQWRNRQLLQVSAGLSGITLYVGEDWHISFGDNLAALDATGKIEQGYEAKYGPIKDFDRATGEITSIYSATELDIMFDY